MKKSIVIAILLSTFILSACGGSSSGSGSGAGQVKNINWDSVVWDEDEWQ